MGENEGKKHDRKVMAQILSLEETNFSQLNLLDKADFTYFNKSHFNTQYCHIQLSKQQLESS